MATNKTLLPAPYLTLEDADGHTIVGGTVTFLETGTAVLAVVYADANGLVISANPLTVDGAGRYTVFLTPGQVIDVEYRDALGALVKTVPGVQAVPSASGNVDTTGTAGALVTAGQLVVLSDGSGPSAAGQWYPASNNNALTVRAVHGIALVGAGAGSAITVRTSGRVDGLSGLVPGAVYYVSPTLGALALVPPAPGFYGRIVGQADSTTSLVFYANPPEIAPADEQIYNGGGNVAQFVPTARTVKLAPGSLLTIQGIKAGYHGQRVRFINIVVNAQVDFINASGQAASADRLFNMVSSGPTSIASGVGRGVVEYEFDATVPGWRLTFHEQGGWIRPAFSAADYAGDGGLIWTVTAGQVLVRGYYLHGRDLRLQLRVHQSTLSGLASSQMHTTIPGGYQCNVSMAGPIIAGNPDLPPAGGFPIWSPSGGLIYLFGRHDAGVNWVPGTFSVAFDIALAVD